MYIYIRIYIYVHIYIYTWILIYIYTYIYIIIIMYVIMSYIYVYIYIIWGFLKMGNPQVTIGFITKSWWNDLDDDLGDLGTPKFHWEPRKPSTSKSLFSPTYEEIMRLICLGCWDLTWNAWNSPCRFLWKNCRNGCSWTQQTRVIYSNIMNQWSQ